MARFAVSGHDVGNLMPDMVASPTKHPVVLSIGILAWNEEDSIRTTLESLLRQSVFERLSARNQRCEIVVVANACTDRTVAVAREVFDRMAADHEGADGFDTRVVDLPEQGKANAWNRFVHGYSSPGAEVLCLMDADIVFHHPNTIFNLMDALQRNPHANAASGRQCKDIQFKPRKSLWDRVSLATSAMSATGAGLLCGQLYCVRAAVARRMIHLPRSLSVEDGFIKELLCTDAQTRPSDPRRVIAVPEAAHIFEAYVKPADVLNNQRRQMIGQATVHVLVSYIKSLPPDDRVNLADTLRRHDQQEPDWLKKLVAQHLSVHPRFWQIFPGLVTFRFRRLWKLPGWRKFTHLPAACIGFVVTMTACWRAHTSLQKGKTGYWPKAFRQTILSMPQSDPS